MCGARGAALATMLVLVAGSPGAMAAQEIPRDEYLRRLATAVALDVTF